jgi:hypothetical protein
MIDIKIIFEIKVCSSVVERLMCRTKIIVGHRDISELIEANA